MNGAAAARVLLGGGRSVLVRPVTRADLPAMEALLMGLSPRSRRLRFHGAVNALPCTALRDLTAPDDDRHATFVAAATGDDGMPRLVAEARWVRVPGDAAHAEFALSVADDWQRLGLARLLLERLRASAAEAAIASIHGSVLDENGPMLALLGSLGARPRRDPRAGYGLVWNLSTARTAADLAQPLSDSSGIAPPPAPSSPVFV